MTSGLAPGHNGHCAGNKQSLSKASQAFHAKGVQIYADISVNPRANERRDNTPSPGKVTLQADAHKGSHDAHRLLRRWRWGEHPG
jgi:hypothetical protein